jgi:hypothetical protein
VDAARMTKIVLIRMGARKKEIGNSLKEALNPINILLRPKYADKAAFVAAGIQVQIPLRKR